MSIIGQSAALLKTLAEADKVAASAARVLIGGETGTGKELLATRIHATSLRRDKPFVAINCSALPPALLESELFGHVRGAFTEAHRTREGLVASAAGGTLFLDEIAEMEPQLQAKILRFLETGEFRKVGSSQLEKADVRVISATHRNLKSLAARHLFREDLYYRLSVLTLFLPPLRTRTGDTALLARHFLERFSREEGKNFTGIAPEALALLERYSWPGNIRELQNTIHKTVVLGEGPQLTAIMLEGALPCFTAGGEFPDDNVVSLRGENGPAPPRALWQVEEEAIESAIRYCRGNIPRAAALLQVSPSTLYRRRGNPPEDSKA